MNSLRPLLLSLLLALSTQAADFVNGQAARAVIAQPSFSSREPGIAAVSLVISNTRLYAADATHRLFTFDLTKIPGPKDDLVNRQGSTCVVCGFAPLAVANQSVTQGVAAFAVFGKTLIVADTPNRRVLIWRDVSSPHAALGPDIVLGRPAADSSLVSPTAFIEPISVAFDGKRLFVGDAALHRVLIWNAIPSFDNQAPDAVLGQPNFSSANLTDTPGPDTITRPAALASDGVTLFVADSLDRRILLFSPGDAPLSPNAIVNSASLADGPLAPGTLITISGSGFSDTTASAPDDALQPLPKKLSGVEVLFNGALLPLLSASPTQLRAQIPYSLDAASSASLYIRTQHSDGTITVTNPTALNIVPATPGLFAFSGTEPRNALILHAGSPVTSDSPAKPGEVLTLWAAGLGDVDETDPAAGPIAGEPYSGAGASPITPVEALVNGLPAQVVSATLPQSAVGVYQIRIALPADLPSNSKAQLLIVQSGYISNTVTFPVQSAIH